MRKSINDLVKNQVPFVKKKQNIGDVVPVVKEDAFLDVGETHVKTEDYKDYLGGVDTGSAPFPFKSDYEGARALGQSNWEQAGHAVARLLPNTALEIVNQGAALLDLEDYANSDDEVGNWLSTWAQDMKAEVDEATPIYQEKPGEALQVGDFAWWMENGTNLVQSATAFVALGYATGGLSLSAVTKGAQAVKWLGTLGKAKKLGDTATKGTRAVSALTNATLLNHAEGYGIATQVYDQAYNDTLKELNANSDLTEEQKVEEAKQEASRKAVNALSFNKTNILLNLSSASMFLKGSRLTRQLLKNPSLKKTAQRSVLEGLQESAEESINLAAEKRALEDDFSTDKVFDDIFTKEGAESALLGFIGGAGQTGLTTAGRELKIRRDAQGNRTSDNALLRSQVLDQQEAIDRWETLSKSEKLTSVTDAFMTVKEQGELYDELRKADKAGDIKKVNDLKDKIFYNQAYNAFHTGTTTQFEEVIKGIANLTEEEAEQKGLDTETYKEDAFEALNTLRKLEDAYTESKGYANQQDVYSNQAELIALRNSDKQLLEERNKVWAEVQEYASDMKLDLTDDLQASETELNKIPKYDVLKHIDGIIDSRTKRKQKLIEEYKELTSDSTQYKVRSARKAKTNELKRETRKKEAQEKKQAETNEKETVRQKIKKKVQTVTKKKPASTTPPVSSPEQQSGSRFKLDDKFKGIEDTLNDILNNPKNDLEKKIAEIARFQETTQNMQGNEEFKQPILIQTAQVLRELNAELEEQKANNVKQTVAQSNLTESITKLAEDLEEDFALPSDGKEKVLRRTEMIYDILDKMESQRVDVNNFVEVGTYFKTALGEERFIKLYLKIQGLFNQVVDNKYATVATYEELFLDIEQQEQLLRDNQVVAESALPSELYNIFEEELLADLDEKHKNLVRKQGYKIHEGENATVEGLTVVEGHNKIAHLDKKYKENARSEKTDKFNVLDFVISKTDLDKKLNSNASEEVLDFRELNAGSPIRFVVLDQVVYDDGTIAYADGTIERNGTVEKNDPVMSAPIGIEYKGKILKGAFLHVPDWINADNTHGDVVEQKELLVKIRQAVINSKDGISTTVKYRGDGFPLVDPNGFVNKTNETMNEVRLAVGKDGIFYTGKNQSEVVENYTTVSGRLYALFPVNTGKDFATPLQGQPLSERPEYIESLKKAVEVYLINDNRNPIAVKIKSELGYDITTLEGLNEYFSDFIYVSRTKDTFSKFREKVTLTPDRFSLINFTDFSINFSIGKNIGNTATSIDRAYLNKIEPDQVAGQIDKVLEKLDKVLNHNLAINPQLNKLNKSFKLAVIKGDQVDVQEFNDYNEFLKDHSYTANYSYKLPNGNTIYTVQSTLEFDEHEIIKRDIPAEIIAETIEPGTEVQPTLFDEIEEGTKEGIGFNEEDSLSDFEDFSPRTLTSTEEKQIRDTTPDTVSIKGVPVGIQETVVDHLVNEVTKRYIKDKNSNAFRYIIDEFSNTLENVLRPAYAASAAGVTGTANKEHAALTKVIDALIDNYSVLQKLAIEKLQRVNGLHFDGTALKEINLAVENDLLNDEGFDTVDEVEEDDVALDYGNWASDATFREDYRDKISTAVKNLLSVIPQINPETRQVQTTIFNIPKMLPLETVLNDVTAILAYNNNQEDVVSIPDFDVMISLLEAEIENKPYLEVVVKILKETDDQTKNKFVRAMSKHYTHHKYAVKSFKNGESFIYFSNSDSNVIDRLIQNRWLNNLFATDLIKARKNDFTIDKKEVKRLKDEVDEIVTQIKSDTVDNAKVVKLFNDLGVDIDETFVRKLQNKGITISGKPQVLIHVLKNSDGFIKIYLERLEYLVGKNILVEHPFENVGIIRKFAKEVAKLYPSYYAHSFKDVRGRNYFAYAPNKFLVDRIKELKNNPDLIKQLQTQPFSSESFMLNQLLKDDNMKYLNYSALDGYSLDTKGKKYEQLTPSEQEELKTALFFSQNRKKGDNYLVNLFYPTTSDKSTIYTYSTVGWDFKRSTLPDPKTGDTVLSSKGYQFLYDKLVKPEIKRILAAQLNPEKYDYKGTKEGSLMFMLFPELNAIDALFHENSRVLKDVLSDKSLEQLIINHLRKKVNELVDQRVVRWRDANLVKEEVKTITQRDGTTEQRVTKVLDLTGEEVRAEAFNYEINYLLGNMGVFQLFTTDPANYWKSSHWKTVAKRHKLTDVTREDVLEHYSASDWIEEHNDSFDNMGKRLAGDMAPGEDPTDAHKETFNIAHIADNVITSKAMKHYLAVLGERASAYENINATDAQEFTTFKEHLSLMVSYGELSKKEMNVLLKKEKQGQLTQKDLNYIFQPMKPRYVYNVWKNGVERRVYIKSSGFPLIKQLTKGLEIDAVRQAMEKAKIDRIVYESALKIGGNSEVQPIFNNDGTVVENLQEVFETTRIDSLPRAGFKIQQQIPYDENKNQITNPTQLVALITAPVRDVDGHEVPGDTKTYTGKEIQTKIEENYQELFRLKYENLARELEYDIETNSLNLEKLKAILKEEGIKRNYPLYDLEAFNVENGKFAVPLWATGVSSKIQSMLNSIVDNRIRKHKPRGNSFVLGSSHGFKPVVIEGESASEYIAANTGIVLNEDWAKESGGVLRPMRIEKGKIQPAEVIAPFRIYDKDGKKLKLSDYTRPDGTLDLNNISEEVLEMLGFRIPTQGLKSMAYIKIVGFLPEANGDLILAPSEFTVQMGSDFDVDKLYALMYHLDSNGKKLTKLNSSAKTDNSTLRIQQIDNNLLDLYFSVLKNPHPRTQRAIASPLDFGMLLELADEIYPLVKEGGDRLGVSEDYQHYKYNNAKAGKIGVGVFSNDIRFMANISDSGLAWINRKRKYISFGIGGKSSNLLTYPYAQGTQRTKLEIIEAYQSLAVDNENEQGMHKLNINQHTFNFIRSMAMSGFQEDIISFVLAQPIIRSYVKLREQGNPYPKFEIMEEFPLPEDHTDNELKLKTFVNVSREELKKGIEGETNNQTQREIYNLFNYLSFKGGELQRIQAALNSFNAGIGKNIFYSIAKEEQFKELEDLTGRYAGLYNLIGDVINLDVNKPSVSNPKLNGIFALWDKAIKENKQGEIIKRILDGGYLPMKPISRIVDGKKRYNTNVQFIKPTTIPALATVYATVYNNNIWGEYFPYNNPAILTTIKALKDVRGLNATSITEDADISESVFKSIKSYLTSKAVSTYTEGDIVSERERLFVDTRTNKSLATIIHELKTSGKLNNVFINRLELDLKRQVLPSTVKYKANIAENLYEREIYQSFNSMLLSKKKLGTFNGIEYTLGMLARDMVTAQLISGGIQGANQFLKYVPINYLRTIGFYDAMSKDISESINPDIVLKQSIQHNPKLVNKPKYDSKQTLDNIVPIEGTNSIRFLPDASYGQKFMAFTDKNTVKGYRLYQQDSDENKGNIYHQISTLGYNDMLEYHFDEPNATSSIPNNNPIDPASRPIPEKGKEKEFHKIVPPLDRKSEVVLEPDSLNIEAKYNLTEPNFNYILSEILNHSDNAAFKIMANAILTNSTNTTILNGIRFIIDTNLAQEGSFNLKDKTIKINPEHFNTPEEFEAVFLEEVIHAITKQAILDNKKGEILKLKGLRTEAREAVINYMKTSLNVTDAQVTKLFEVVENAAKTGAPLTAMQKDVIYPLINDEEFIGRLFKSKALQQILNDAPSKSGATSLWERFKDFISTIMQGFGFEIKKDSILDYALSETISLINTPTPTPAVQEELKKVNPIIRTVENIEEKFNLRDSAGNLNPIRNAAQVAKHINDTLTGVVAEVITEEFEVANEQLALFDQDSIESIPEYIVITNLPKINPTSAKKETGGKVGTNQDINPSYLSKDGLSVEAAAEKIYADHFAESNVVDEFEIRDIIINILTQNKKEYIASLTGKNEEATKTETVTYVKVTYDENTSYSPATVKTASKIGGFRDNFVRRIKFLQDEINKAQAQKDFKTVERLKKQVAKLDSRLVAIVKINTLTPLIVQGQQDMQELAELFNRGLSIEDTIYIKEVTDYWSNLDKLLFTEDDRYTDDMSAFKAIEVQARQFADKLHVVEEKYVEDILAKYGKNATVKEIFQYFNDINGLAANTLDISRFDNELLSNLLIKLKEANNAAIDDTNSLLKELAVKEEAVRAALKSLNYNSDELFEVFRQKDKKGRLTGHIVKRYSLDFLKKKGRFMKGLSSPSNRSSYLSLLNWAKTDTEDIKINLLFPTKEVDKEAQKEYIAELKEQLGETHYNEFYKEQKAKIERYKAQQQNFTELLIEEYDVENREELLKIEKARKALMTWESQHSPYSYYRQKNEGLTKREMEMSKFRNAEYISFIPKGDKHYDSNFSVIEGNKALYDFYQYYQEVDYKLQQLLPEKERLNLAFYGIPYMKQTSNNAFRGKGMKAALTPLRDGIAETIRIKAEGKEDINPINNRAYRSLDVVLTKDNSLEIKLYLTNKTIEYREEHGEDPTANIINEWKSDIIHELSQKKSFDLPSVLKMYSLTALTYSHKAKVEDYIRLIQNIFERQKEIRRNAKGEIILNERNEADIKEASNSFQNTKAALDYTANAFYGITKQNEAATSKKAYTSEEKKLLEDIDNNLLKLETQFKAGTINEEEYEFQVEELEGMRDQIGGIKVWSRKGDALLKYVQLKGMGWNFMSSIANIGFGFISNYVEAAGGLLYSRKSLNKGYALTRYSMVRNATFNRGGGEVAMKIRTLMDKWDVLKDASKELYQDPLGVHLPKKHRWLEPYNLTQRTEYLNQAPLMIALLLDKKFEVDGKEINYWDAFNNDGTWNEEKYGPEPKQDLNKLRLKLDQIIKSNHGNYDPVSALKVKDKFLGRALSQFRTWMFEGVANRFEKKKYDDLLEEYRKGRYITAFEYLGEYEAKGLMNIFKGIIRSATFGKVFANATFDSITDNEKFDRIDAANMRKFASEVVMLINIYSAYLVLSMAAAGLDDEEDPIKKYVANNLINQGLRLKTDILFYLNPAEFKNLMRDLLPVASVITDIGSWLDAVKEASMGNDEIKSGVYSGHSRLLRESSQMLPFGSQVYKNINYSVQTFDKD